MQHAAELDQIAALPGFGPTTAQAVFDALRTEEPQVAINMTTGEVTEL